MKSNLKKELKTHSSFKELFAQWWWVVLFLSVILLTYDRIREDVALEGERLHKKLLELNEEKNKTLEENIELQLTIQSQTDPEWIKLTLKKRLGVVPEGQKKVHFKGSE